MTKKEIKALRRPFIRTLFRKNKFNLVMTVTASLLAAAANLVISWLIKEVSDLISGDSELSFRTLLFVAGIAFALLVLGWVLDRVFLSEFRSKAMKQYRDYVFDRLMGKGIQAFSAENSSLYISALSNDVNTIERDFIGQIQLTIQVAVTFIGALVLMILYSPLLTVIAIGFSLIPIIASVVLGNKAAAAEKDVSDKKESYTGMLKDALTGFAVIKSFKAEQSISKVHSDLNKDVSRSAKNAPRSMCRSDTLQALRAVYCNSACSSSPPR